MEVFAAFLILVGFLTTIVPLKNIPDGQVSIPGTMQKIELTQKYEVKPLSVFKDANIIKQKFDYSCGSAALATLMNYYLGEKLSEQQVIQGLMQYGDSEMIEKRRAFSLLDMKRFVEVLGYKGFGYTAELSDLRELRSPCIVPIEFFGYKHFVVYKGMHGDHIFFADPYMGNINFTISEFEKMWSKNIVFLVNSDGATMKALLLKEEDLVVVTLDMTKVPFPGKIPPDFITNEHRVRETLGDKYQYKSINVQ